MLKINNKKIMFLRYVCLTAVIALCYPGVLFSSEIIDRVVAVVNDSPITLSELNLEASPLLASVKDEPESEEKKEKIKKIREKVLDSLIDQMLQMQEAKSLGLSIGDETVEMAIEDQKKSYDLSDEQFEESLRRENVTIDDYNERIRMQLTIMSLMNNVVKPKIVINSNEIKEYYDSNIDYFTNEGSITLDQLVILKETGEEKTAQHYENKVNEIYVKAQNSKSLDDLEKEYAEDFLFIKYQRLGEFRKNELADEFKEAYSLKTGETALVKTEKACHILKLVNRRGDSVKPFAEASEEIKNIIFSKKSEKILKNYIESLRNKSFIEKRL